MSKPNKKSPAKIDATENPEAEIVAADPSMTVAELCRHVGVDPKAGRGKLRKHGYSANGGHYARLTPGTPEFDRVANIVTSAGQPKA